MPEGDEEIFCRNFMNVFISSDNGNFKDLPCSCVASITIVGQPIHIVGECHWSQCKSQETPLVL